jgi:hypothetical protein
MPEALYLASSWIELEDSIRGLSKAEYVVKRRRQRRLEHV